MTTKKKNALTPETIRETAMAFQRARILLSAYELSVFTFLGGGEKTSKETAKALKTDPRATDRLMNALCAMEFLEKKDGKFNNSPLAANFLVRGKPGYMAGLMHSVHLWDTWSCLTASVRAGKPEANKKIGGRGDKWLEGFIAAMHERAYKTAPEVVKLIDLKGVSKILDVGGGSAAYSMAFVNAKKGVTATIFDLPEVVPITKGYIEKEGLSDKIDTMAGDYHSDKFGKGYDLIFLSAIVHINSYAENMKLINRCAKALNNNGLVIVQDFVVSEDRTDPPMAAFFALNMLVGTECGDTYTESEIGEWMSRAGLSNIVRRDTPFKTSLVIGRKA